MESRDIENSIENKNTKKKLERFNKVFPWYAGLSMDLLFWVAIDTLFLTVVKGLTTSQIVSLTSISVTTCILLQYFILKIIKKMGNTKSVRIGSALLLLSSIILTLGKSFILIALGRIIFEVAVSFNNMAGAILKNNLEMQSKGDDFIKLASKANVIYAVVTMIISFVAGYIFNINNYLPMFLCIAFCLLCFILSFEMKDYSDNNKIKNEVQKEKYKIKFNKIIIIVVISYALFYPVVGLGQSNGKLLIQQELLNNIDVERTAIILGGIVCLSRIVRTVSNIVFGKIYKKYKNKVGIILSTALAIALTLMIIGGSISSSLILKFTMLILGYITIVFIRDPFRVYTQDVALKNISKEERQTLLTILELGRKIIRAILSLGFSLVLVNSPMIVVILILLILSIIEIFISAKVYKKIKSST